MQVNDVLRDGVIAVARQAAAAILAVYDGEFAVQHKDDRSPLTAADLAAHRCIVSRLAELTPAIPVLSEESKDHDIADRRQWTRFWLVDPLDGTREFIKRNGEFTVNIALIEDGVAVFGVIQQPVTGALKCVEQMIVMHARQRIDGIEPVRDQRGDRGFAGRHLAESRLLRIFGLFWPLGLVHGTLRQLAGPTVQIGFESVEPLATGALP